MFVNNNLKNLLLFIESEKIPSADEILNAGHCEDDDNIFYHATPVRNLPSILKRGLQPSSGEQVSFSGLGDWSKGKVFVSAGGEDARMWQEMIFDEVDEPVAVLRLQLTNKQVQKLQVDKVSYQENDPCSFFLTTSIKPSQITVVDTGEDLSVSMQKRPPPGEEGDDEVSKILNLLGL